MVCHDLIVFHKIFLMTPGRLYLAAEYFQLDGNSSAPAEQLYKICIAMISFISTGYFD